MRKALAIAAFFALVPGFAVGGALGLPVLMGVAAVAALSPAAANKSFKTNRLILGVLAALVTWLVLSRLWSPWHGETYIKLPVMIGLGLLFSAAAGRSEVARVTLASASAALFVLIAMLIIEAVGGSPLNGGAAPNATEYQLTQAPARGAVVMLALLWPALAWFATWRTIVSWLAIIAILLSAGFVSLQFGQQSNALGFALGGGAFLFALIAPRLAILLPAFGLAAWTALAPFATLLLFVGRDLPDWAPHSWNVRVGIWLNTSERILQQPWIGHGLDAGRTVREMTTYDGEALAIIPLHPHSAALQIWYDSGVIGAGLAAAVLVLTGLALARAYANNKFAAATAAAVLVMFGAMANIGWSPAQEWWLATMILAGALVAAIGSVAIRTR
ncbi:MAG: hypothetical protein ABL889_00620 [Terricaulis sp.]